MSGRRCQAKCTGYVGPRCPSRSRQRLSSRIGRVWPKMNHMALNRGQVRRQTGRCSYSDNTKQPLAQQPLIIVKTLVGGGSERFMPDRDSEELRAAAVRCRRLANLSTDHSLRATLRMLADEYETRARTSRD